MTRQPAGEFAAGVRKHAAAQPPAIDPRLLRKSFAQLEPQSDKAMAYFYSTLFLRNPELRAMFPLAMDGQRRRLFDGLGRCVWGAGQQPALAEYLRDLARAHRKFGVTGKHYKVFCDTLLTSLRTCGDGWDEATEAAWRALLDWAATVMAEAADAVDGEPAWWLGEIVRRERRGPDVAVVTIRPGDGEPLRYQAGQYLSIQLPQWPRVWRCYSAANAPRPDGTVDLHVRAVPGGRISTQLVEQALPGDSLVIGPPRGAMTVAAAGSGAILCVAGGTGLAPVKALAEELAQRGEAAPAIRLVAGARNTGDLYDLPDLQRLAASCPSLTVIPVIATPGTATRGVLPAAAADQLTPDTSDIFVAGPDGMVRATVRRLAALAPGATIHTDVAAPHLPDRRQQATGERGDAAKPPAAARRRAPAPRRGRRGAGDSARGGGAVPPPAGGTADGKSAGRRARAG